MGDVTLTYPYTGVGEPQPRNLRDRARAKVTKHAGYLRAQSCGFIPLAATTRGQLEPEFLRYLWICAHLLMLWYFQTRAWVATEASPEWQAKVRARLYHRYRAQITVAVLKTSAERGSLDRPWMDRPPDRWEYADPPELHLALPLCPGAGG